MSVSTSRQEASGKYAVSRGVVTFAGVMLVTLSILAILQGIAAIAKDDVYVTGVEYTYEFSVEQWGWTTLVLGIIGVVIGLGILLGNAVAQVFGIVIAALSAILQFGFLPYYPLWAIVIIAFDVFVIWALCVEMSRRDT